MFSIGIDIGYSTLKCVVISDEKIQVYNSNIFHHGNVDKLLKELLEKLQNQFKIENCYIGITGQKEKFLKEYQVNDISALVEGTIFTNKEIKSIIEIGAQSSRLITGISNKSRVGIKFFSNTSCSAGTGSFLEEQVSRLGIRLDEYSDYIKDAKKVIRIAGRCSVFSKTDMIHHQQAGEKTEDILLGLSYALARNYKANVVQRNNIQKPVMFVGGVAKNVGVVRAIKEIFNFSEEDFIIPSDCSSIGALGVAILVRNKKDIVNIQNVIDNIGSKSKVITYSLYNPLKDYGENDSAGKHNCKNIDAVLVDGYIGIDIGSTSTNVVLINGDREIIAYRYIRTKGNPKKAVDDAMKSIKAEFKGRLNIKSIGTTGSGRNLVENLLGADVVVNEITAQSKGATEMDAEVDTIFEIGGQDSKYISVKNCRVVDFEMNKICAAGTGSFIEEQSKKLAIPIEEYADIALKGNNPLDLGNRCTVFIEGNISKAIADGESKENIIAGLSYSIVNNYLNRVVGKKPIGKKIFLQGGIAYNQAVVNAFRSVTGKEIIVPPFFSVTGAFGVALLANENVENENEKENKLIASKYRNVQSEIDALFLKGYTGNIEKDKLTVGIPRVLFLHKLFPLFNVFFKELGFNVILSDETDSNIVEMSQEYSLDETCYPIKLINGHVASLLKRNVDYIFLPSLYTMKHPISKTREDYACVYMQKAPQIVSKVMDLQERGIKLLSPALSFKFGKKYMMNTLMKLGSDLEKSKLQTTLALAKGMKRFKQFEDDVEELGKDVISKLEDDEKVFVIITRAYGVADKGLNMGIPEKLRKMGYKVLTLSNLPAHSLDISEDYPNMFWPFGQHILSGARIVKKSKNLYAIYLTNHGCGPDTILSHYFKEEMRDKPYLHIEVDEHASSVGVMTRLEAFVESLKNENTDLLKSINKKNSVKVISNEEEIYIPYLYPYSKLLQGLLIRKGINAIELLPTNRESIEIGKKHSISKESVSLISLLGDVFLQVGKNIDKNKNINIWIPTNEGSEVFGQFGRLIEQKIKLAGHKNINIESPFIEDMLTDEKYGNELGLILIAGDLIMNSDIINRKKNLEEILTYINNGLLTREVLIEMASKINKQLVDKRYEKNLYVLGEASVIFNPFINNCHLEKLEYKNKLFYAPISEMIWFSWYDYFIKKKSKNKLVGRNLKEMKDTINLVSKELRKFSPFDKNLSEMVEEANHNLDLYSGGNGRYRMIKQYRCSNGINGILNLNSMYENTGTILKLLKDEKKINCPILEVSFDESKHSGNDEKIDNFIYYI